LGFGWHGHLSANTKSALARKGSAAKDALRSFSAAGQYALRYLITSAAATGQHRYIGYTDDLRQRVADHNAGKNISTALAFEQYLKSGSGHAFANKRLW